MNSCLGVWGRFQEAIYLKQGVSKLTFEFWVIKETGKIDVQSIIESELYVYFIHPLTMFNLRFSNYSIIKIVHLISISYLCL